MLDPKYAMLSLPRRDARKKAERDAYARTLRRIRQAKRTLRARGVIDPYPVR